MTQNDEWTLNVKSPEWYYFSIKLVFINEAVPIEIITWKMLILAALKKMHGLVGEATHFDILHTDGSKCVVRVPTEDRQMIEASLVGYKGNLKSVGLADTPVSIRVIERSQYLVGVTGPDRRAWLNI